MLDTCKVMEIIYYMIDNSMDRPGISVSVNFYADNIEVSMYHTNIVEGNNGKD